MINISARNWHLLSYGTVMPFRELTDHAKKAIQAKFNGQLIFQADFFWHGKVPVKYLKAKMLCDTDHPPFDNFDEYHRWYTNRRRGPMPQYSKIDLWPVFLSGIAENNKTLTDGYHRFHRYVCLGISKIPAIATTI